MKLLLSSITRSSDENNAIISCIITRIYRKGLEKIFEEVPK